MFQGTERKHDVRSESQQLLQGPLKHTRTAALALALVPLAAVAVSTQVNESCASGGICGTVFYDTTPNGIQDAGEPGIPGVSVTITYVVDGTPYTTTVPTDDNGVYDFGTFLPRGEYEISVQIPPNTTASPANQGTDDAADSDGTPDTSGSNSTAKVNWSEDETQDSTTDFGFTKSAATNPGTGTPGYWVNHPEAWPVQSLVIGGRTYTKDQALAALKAPVAKDKTYTMFASLVAAMLNVAIGNDPSCVQDAMNDAQGWFATYGPVGSGVAASSFAWKIGEPFHRRMDNYNNGMLCVSHRE
jgi:hypothetical protein